MHISVKSALNDFLHLYFVPFPNNIQNESNMHLKQSFNTFNLRFSNEASNKWMSILFYL